MKSKSKSDRKAITLNQLKKLVRESDDSSGNEIINQKKEIIKEAKARIDEMFTLIGMTLDEIEQVEQAIDCGEIDGSKDERGFINTPDYMVEMFTDIRSSVVDISDVKSDLNNALMSLCSGFKMNHGGLIRGKRKKQ